MRLGLLFYFYLALHTAEKPAYQLLRLHCVLQGFSSVLSPLWDTSQKVAFPTGDQFSEGPCMTQFCIEAPELASVLGHRVWVQQCTQLPGGLWDWS